MGRDARVLNRVAIVWRPNLRAYIADCECGRSVITLKLSAGEQWALEHECEQP